jgi:hypothetical protein
MMAVPKAAVNKNDLLSGPEYDVWAAGKLRNLEPEAISEPVEEGPKQKLGFCITLLHAGHER